MLDDLLKKDVPGGWTDDAVDELEDEEYHHDELCEDYDVEVEMELTNE